MSIATTILHVYGQTPENVERALEEVFAREERPRVLRLEGTFSAVLARVLDPALAASYRYLLCRPHPDARWTPLLELGNRTVGLDVELSKLLAGAPVFTLFEYGEAVSGYRFARDGAEVDRYLSDPTYFTEQDEPGEETGVGVATENGAPPDVPDVGLITDPETERGAPERFADLLPQGTSAEDFANVVLRPGWWEEHESGGVATGTSDEQELVDEVDRMRCIALALELWGPSEYPFTEELEDIPNRVVGPGIVLAFT